MSDDDSNDRIWRGNQPLIIGQVDEAHNVVEEIVVQPGEEIPERAAKLYAKAKERGGYVDVPYDNVYSHARVKAAAHWGRLVKFGATLGPHGVRRP